MTNREGLQEQAREIIAHYPQGKQRAAIVPLLHRAQERDGYVTSEAIEEIAVILGLAAAEVRGVASFYSMLHLEPKGRHVVSVCHNIACSIAGAEALVGALERKLGISADNTTSDGEFTLERAECLAACDLAPMLQLDYDRMIGPLTPEQAEGIVEELSGTTLQRASSAIDEIGIAPRPFRERRPDRDEPAPLIESITLTDQDRLLLHPEISRKVHEPAPEPEEATPHESEPEEGFQDGEDESDA
ncbi:MAG: NADH-quinone oxidoreductase subunit NuoE [Acidimicrobiia bacterium]